MWQSGSVPLWEEGEPQTGSARTLTPARLDDVVLARRRAPTFGVRPDDPTVLQSVRDFTRRYGWRAYALPVLIVITVLALMTTTTSPKTPHKATGALPAGPSSRPAPPTASGEIPLKSDQPASGARNTVLSSAALPAGAAYTKTGTGTFRVLPGRGPVVGTGIVHKYSVEVENGVSGVALAKYASQVQSVLSDPRSWAGHNRVALQRVTTGADFHVTLVSSMTVRSLCGYDIPIETSCFVPSGMAGSNVNRVVINVARWVRGDAAYVGDLTAYRSYLINHEDGHALGHQHAHQCLPGGLAPVMMQQTLGLRSAATHKMCQANPWPYPVGAVGAPGAEQPDTPQNTEIALKND
jgi:Protein of unknown function (DUF3152)